VSATFSSLVAVLQQKQENTTPNVRAVAKITPNSSQNGMNTIGIVNTKFPCNLIASKAKKLEIINIRKPNTMHAHISPIKCLLASIPLNNLDFL